MVSIREKNKKHRRHVGEPVCILACSLMYLNLPAFLGVETQESRHEIDPTCHVGKIKKKNKCEEDFQAGEDISGRVQAEGIASEKTGML